MGYVLSICRPPDCSHNDPSNSEDQQRINSFSKMNTRLRSIEEKIEELKVCAFVR